MNRQSLRRNQLIFALTITSLILGVMLATQYRITRKTNERLAAGTGNEEVAQLQNSVMKVQAQNQDLQKQVDQLNQQVLKYEQSAGTASQDLLKQLDKARIESGTTAVTGSGITFSVSDDPALVQGGQIDPTHYVHDSDIRWLISELYLSGAEAISINDQRITYASHIQCIGPTIIIDDHKSTVPFVFKAIGDPSTLSTGMSFPGGILDYMKNTRKLMVKPVQTIKDIRIQPYNGTFNDILSMVAGSNGSAAPQD